MRAYRFCPAHADDDTPPAQAQRVGLARGSGQGELFAELGVENRRRRQQRFAGCARRFCGGAFEQRASVGDKVEGFISLLGSPNRRFADADTRLDRDGERDSIFWEVARLKRFEVMRSAGFRSGPGQSFVAARLHADDGADLVAVYVGVADARAAGDEVHGVVDTGVNAER